MVMSQFDPKKEKVAVLLGGRSAERAVSLMSGQRVVDRLEAVKVDVGHRQLLAAPLRLRHNLLQAVRQQQAVGQLGQRIKVRQPLQHVLMRLDRRNV